jgi:hypothetical protein
MQNDEANSFLNNDYFLDSLAIQDTIFKILDYV